MLIGPLKPFENDFKDKVLFRELYNLFKTNNGAARSRVAAELSAEQTSEFMQFKRCADEYIRLDQLAEQTKADYSHHKQVVDAANIRLVELKKEKQAVTHQYATESAKGLKDYKSSAPAKTDGVDYHSTPKRKAAPGKKGGSCTLL